MNESTLMRAKPLMSGFVSIRVGVVMLLSTPRMFLFDMMLSLAVACERVWWMEKCLADCACLCACARV